MGYEDASRSSVRSALTKRACGADPPDRRFAISSRNRRLRRAEAHHQASSRPLRARGDLIMAKAKDVFGRIESWRLSILFLGDCDRGRRIQAIARRHGWRCCLPPEQSVPTAKIKSLQPEIVVLDGFPDSRRARAAFYQLWHFQGPRFLALNDCPGASRFLHVDGLSFIRIIERAPGPVAFTRAVLDLVGAQRPIASPTSNAAAAKAKSFECCPLHPSELAGETCC